MHQKMYANEENSDNKATESDHEETGKKIEMLTIEQFKSDYGPFRASERTNFNSQN